MLKTHVHLDIHVEFEHPESVDPEEVLQNLDYSIGSDADGVTIVKTEIVEQTDTITQEV